MSQFKLGPGANRYDGYDLPTLESYERFVAEDFNKSHPHGHLKHDAHSTGSLYEYVILDSYAADDTELSEGRFAFELQRRATSDRAIGINLDIERAFLFEMSSFTIPLPSPTSLVPSDDNGLTYAVNTSDPTTGTNALTNPLTQLPDNGRVVLEFTNINQGVYNLGGKRHHFIFTTALNAGGDRLVLTPIRSRHVFTEPVPEITRLEVQFRNPGAPVVLPADTIVGVTISTSSDMVQFTGPSGVTINSLLSAGDRIYFEDVQTSNGELNKVLTREEGHLVGSGGLSSSVFRLNPDISITGAGSVNYASTSTIKVRIAKNRIRIPFHIRGLTDRHTNYLMPTTS